MIVKIYRSTYSDSWIVYEHGNKSLNKTSVFKKISSEPVAHKAAYFT
jgi:hypothetical protein